MNAARVLAVAFVAVALSLFVYVRAPGRHPGIESHYHYRLGAEIAGGDWAPNPGAHLPWGAMAEAYPVDHHWGLHALIAPFAALGDAMGDHEAALKAASVGFVLLSVLGLYLALRLAGAPSGGQPLAGLPHAGGRMRLAA